MAKRIEGKVIAQKIHEEIQEKVARLAKRGVQPCLSAILVGDHPASHVYVKSKQRACESLGVLSQVHHLPCETSQDELLHLINTLNKTPHVHGILVQLPLPDHISESKVLEQIHYTKDVDGFHPMNKGLLLEGRARLLPCTPAGIMKIFDYESISLEGLRAVVVGRSNIVGKPMALLLLQRHATVTICHSRTRNLPEILKQADLVVAAMGRPGYIQPEWVTPGSILIDVGITPVSDEAVLQRWIPPESPRWEAFRKRGRLLIGDFSPLAYEKAQLYTPVPGGVGPLTVAMVVYNTVMCAELQTYGQDQ